MVQLITNLIYKIMKKIFNLFLITILASFILPGVALASWYNPFSWNWKALFNSPVQTETQNSITATSTISTSTAPNNFEPLTQEQMASMAKKASNSKPITQQPKQNSDNNSVGLYAIYDNTIAFTGMDIDQRLSPFSVNASHYISDITTLIDKFNGYAISDPADSRFINTAIALYEIDKNNIIASKKKIDDYIMSLKAYISMLKDKQSQLKNTFVSKDEALSIMDSLNQNDKQISSTIDSIIKEYLQVTDSFDNNKKLVSSTAQSLANDKEAQLQSLQNQRQSLQLNYAPPAINFFQTHCQFYGDSASCTTY